MRSESAHARRPTRRVVKPLASPSSSRLTRSPRRRTELAEAARAPVQNPAESLADLDRARQAAHTAALALETAALDSLDALLQERLNRITFERSSELLAGAAIVLAAGLLWLINRPERGQTKPAARPEIGSPNRTEPSAPSAAGSAGQRSGGLRPTAPTGNQSAFATNRSPMILNRFGVRGRLTLLLLSP